MNKKQPIHFLEVVWIILAVACFILGIQKAINNFLSQSVIFFLLAAISFAMYALRKHMRKNMKSK